MRDTCKESSSQDTVVRGREVEQHKAGRAWAGLAIEVRGLQVQSTQLGCLWFEVCPDRSYGLGIAITRVQHMAVDE